MPTEDTRWDNQGIITTSNALDVMRSKNYAVVTKIAKRIVNEKIKQGSQDTSGSVSNALEWLRSKNYAVVTKQKKLFIEPRKYLICRYFKLF